MTSTRITFWATTMLAAAALAGGVYAQPAAEPGLPEGTGKEQLSAVCTACHGLDLITSEHRSSKQWNETVDLMISRGATVTDEDRPLIVAYLGTHFGATPPAGSVPAQ